MCEHICWPYIWSYHIARIFRTIGWCTPWNLQALPKSQIPAKTIASTQWVKYYSIYMYCWMVSAWLDGFHTFNCLDSIVQSIA
jgi:hypothetical protein